MENRVSIAILTGGLSKRFGKDKMKEPLINGKRMPCYIGEKLKILSDDLFTVGKKVCDFKNYKDLKMVNSPLSGIYTALYYSKHEYVFIVAGDLPFLNVGVVKILLKKLENNEVDVITPFVKGFFEPLFSVYRKSLIKKIDEMLKEKDFKVNNLISSSRYLKVPEDEIKKVDKELTSFLNINTPDDLKKHLKNYS